MCSNGVGSNMCSNRMCSYMCSNRVSSNMCSNGVGSNSSSRDRSMVMSKVMFVMMIVFKGYLMNSSNRSNNVTVVYAKTSSCSKTSRMCVIVRIIMIYT